MKRTRKLVCAPLLLAFATGCASGGGRPNAASPQPPPALAPAPPGPAPLEGRRVPLPGVSGRASLDYLVFEPSRGRVWIPVGDTGSVDVFDPASGQMTSVAGFATTEGEAHGRKRTLGPSSAAVGDGVVYVGDRASSEVCSIDEGTLRAGPCVRLSSPPDGMEYVASAKELWVTTPRAASLTVLDATTPGALRLKTVVEMPGAPEGYAVDGARGLFFTNLEDKDQTVAVDVKTHAVVSTWPSRCGAAGPRGIAVDPVARIVMVACTDHLEVLDGARAGAELARVDTGDGVDNVDWLPPERLLCVAAGKAARLSMVRVGPKGESTVVASSPTAEGARNAVLDASGNAFVLDPMNGGLLVVPFRASR